MNDDIEKQPKAEIVLYQDEGSNVPVQVTYWNETFWMPQKGIADLFGVNVSTISKHLANIYAEKELEEDSTVSKKEMVRNEGGRTVRREITFYDLDAIIAVGYRVNSMQATRFRQWATGTLKEYVIKGFVLNDDMLKNGRPFGEDYFKELLQRVRDIRTSEKRFYVQICEIFQEISYDYDKDSPITRQFYQEVQNRFHFAATGHTAPEIINDRADAGKPHMGLTTWQGSPEGRIHSSDVTIAKNYTSTRTS
ncbi:RhuM family protein [uncultured Bifidobacterium sp.]|uniref:RhuM family protein n=1 Tax=uncultured Bifidobacterium sp. TaxID=165187 RepID=UPI00262EE75F|nr:RhuM family protein [uncultured Bifidobacterium sp.]